MKKITTRSLVSFIFLAAFLLLAISCADSNATNTLLPVIEKKQQVLSSANAEQPIPKADATAILKFPEVPILCYHHIRDWKVSDSRRARDYIVPVDNFRNQMKMLSDKGFHTISPDQLVEHLTTGSLLPANPILLSFDDTDEEQFSIAKTEMDKYGFKGVFFIMTVSLGRPNYMSKEQVKQLSEEGHTIGSHTWDHQNVKKYEEKDWSIQVDRPTHQLETLIGKPIHYFAYPFGLWNTAAIPQLKERGMLAAFQLSAKRDEQNPLYSIRRIIVPGDWSVGAFEKRIKSSF